MRKRLQRRDPNFIYAAGYKLIRGKRYELRAILPDDVVLFKGWFIASSNDPVVRGFSI